MFRFPQLRAPGLLLTLWLAACASPPPAPVEVSVPSCPPPVSCPACPACPACPVCPVVPRVEPTRVEPRLQPAVWADLDGFADDSLREALPALRRSCGRLGETDLWRSFCNDLAALGDAAPDSALSALLRSRLRPWKLVNPDGTDQGLITGYYEPLIRGSRVRSPRARWPVHGVPEDLVSVDLAGLYPDLKQLRLRGRIEGRSLKPYWTRTEIEAQGLRFPAPVLLWAEDPIELFFLHVQGSGRVELPDGSRVRVGYADQNGHPYVSIGRWLIEQGELTLAEASMDGIRRWAEAHPARLAELLGVNPSYVFFREMPAGDDGPVGALGVPLTERRSIAVDPRSIPLGVPVFLDTTLPGSSQPMRRLVLAQDTGGAIKGVVRADFYWGYGAEAGRMAGRMRQQGRMWVLMPTAFTVP